MIFPPWMLHHAQASIATRSLFSATVSIGQSKRLSFLCTVTNVLSCPAGSAGLFCLLKWACWQLLLPFHCSVKRPMHLLCGQCVSLLWLCTVFCLCWTWCTIILLCPSLCAEFMCAPSHNPLQVSNHQQSHSHHLCHQRLHCSFAGTPHWRIWGQMEDV